MAQKANKKNNNPNVSKLSQPQFALLPSLSAAKSKKKISKMCYTKEKLLARLQLRIDFTKHEQPVVLTIEHRQKHVGHLNGAPSKNLFLKDKKHMFYVVSGLPKI